MWEAWTACASNKVLKEGKYKMVELDKNSKQGRSLVLSPSVYINKVKL